MLRAKYASNGNFQFRASLLLEEHVLAIIIPLSDCVTPAEASVKGTVRSNNVGRIEMVTSRVTSAQLMLC